MTLSESVAKLATLVPVLKASDAKFASDLIASFKKYGGLTPKQEPWIERLIARAAAPVAAAPVAVNVGGFAGVVALFNKAKESGLKFPKVRLSLNGTALVLSLNGPKSKFPGHVSISGEGVYPNRAFYGKVSPEGVFTPFKSGLPGLTELLTALASNPARVAKDHGKLTGNCCFCNKVLGLGKEQRSVLVGFGPDCAENYGLKAEWLAAADKAEAKASVSAPASVTVGNKTTYYTPTLAVPASSVAPLKLEGPWIGSESTTGEPTLTVTPAAQEAIDTLADSLAKATGAVSVTVTDGPLTGSSEAAANHEALQAELGPEYANPLVVAHEAAVVGVTCFFCEQQTLQYASLHGFVVCPTCVAQLK